MGVAHPAELDRNPQPDRTGEPAQLRVGDLGAADRAAAGARAGRPAAGRPAAVVQPPTGGRAPPPVVVQPPPATEPSAPSSVPDPRRPPPSRNADNDCVDDDDCADDNGADNQAPTTQCLAEPRRRRHDGACADRRPARPRRCDDRHPGPRRRRRDDSGDHGAGDDHDGDHDCDDRLLPDDRSDDWRPPLRRRRLLPRPRLRRPATPTTTALRRLGYSGDHYSGRGAADPATSADARRHHDVRADDTDAVEPDRHHRAGDRVDPADVVAAPQTSSGRPSADVLDHPHDR